MSFTIGCDPELICPRNGQFVCVSNYFKANSSFGLDGCEYSAEIMINESYSALDEGHPYLTIKNRMNNPA